MSSRTALYSILAATALVVPVFAKQNRAIPAESIDILKRDLAQLTRFTLPNGITCLVKEDRTAPVVAIQIWVGTGSSHEQRYLGAGLSHAIEHMIFKGTDRRKIGDITREINNAGGNINAYTTLDRTVFHTDLPSESWRIGLDVLSDAVMNATFPDEEWKKERNVILREISMGKDSPSRVVNKLLMRTAYSVHPYRAPVIGYQEVFEIIKIQDIRSFFKRNYVSDNMMVVIVGDVQADEVRDTIATTFKDFHRRAWSPPVLPREPRQIAPRTDRNTGAYKVTRLELAYHTVPLSHKDTPALDVLSYIVGHGRSSRLNRELKEDRRLVHSINAWSYTPGEPGMFGVSAIFASDKEDALIEALESQIEAWKHTRFSRKEIAKAQRNLLSSELSQLQTMAGKARSYASGQFYAEEPGFAIQYLEQINAITADDLRAVAQKYLNSQQRTLVILAPVTKHDAESRAAIRTRPQPVEKTVLPNGIPLLVREDHRLPFVHIIAAFRGGSLTETEENSGITTLMSDLLTRGTAAMSSDQIAETIESVGGRISSFSSRNEFGITAKCLSSDIVLMMEILSDCLSSPSFLEREIAKQKEIQMASIDQQDERPFAIAQKQLGRMLFPGHPYRFSSLGTRSSVSALARNDITNHFKSYVARDNMVLALFGDITLEEARKLALKHCGRINPTASPIPEHRRPKRTLPSRAERREPKEQAIFLLGVPGVNMKDKRVDSLRILASALSGLSSRLAMEIREERGLVYYVGAYQRSDVDPGNIVFYAGTREDAVGDVEQLIKAEIVRITTKGLTQEELERARSRIIANHEMRLQNNMSVATSCALDELHGRGHSYIFTTRDRFEKITAEDVMEAAGSLLKEKEFAISIVLPQQQEETQ